MTQAPHLRARTAVLTGAEVDLLAARFRLRVVKGEGDGCWLWAGCRAANGYGRISFGGGKQTWLAHRVAMLLELGMLPAEALVLHRCDVRSCVRPDHLYLGTTADNANDRGGRTGWSGGAPGSRNGKAKLTDDQVRQLRARAARGESRASLGRAFGVSRQTASDIAARKLWRHVS